MSRNQKSQIRHEDTIVPGQFDLRLLNTWEAVSQIIKLRRGERDALRRTFNIHWQDIDLHMRDVLECYRSGTAVDGRPRRANNVRIVHDLKMRPEGMVIILYVSTMTNDRGEPCFVMPDLDENGRQRKDERGKDMFVPAKLSFERVFPASHFLDLFNKAQAMPYGMRAYLLALWASEMGDQTTLDELDAAIRRGNDRLHGAVATVKDAVVQKEKETEKRAEKQGRKSGGKKGDKAKAVKIEDSVEEPAVAAAEEPVVAVSAVDAADDTARKLTLALGLEDPGAGGVEADEDEEDETSFSEVLTPAPVASATPAPAPAPAKAPKKDKEKPKAIKLGSPEGNEKLAAMAASLPSNGTNGQNDQK